MSAANASEQPKHRKETEAKRQEILKAALDVFGRKGAEKGTLEEIASKVGMTRAGVLHHFGSKRKLLLAVIQYNDESEVDAFPDKRIPHGAAAFQHLIATTEHHAHSSGIARSFVTLSSESITDDNPGHAYFQQRYQNLRNELTQALVDMAKERKSTINMAEAEMASASILAMMDGLQLQWLLSQDQIDLSASTAFAINALVSAVIEHHGEPAVI
ncbi:TetR family transcriptional regulator [Bombiscardovia nodaiensis]|uniref:TetR family transcriptional regulator n=1 Tax=Bombiscardovia nodaiensis TaxID=2932181 RepID=A0ABM8B9A9_9BIFI|nr:TetR family transcriptional regulator [Bombiscardovia nodaiensis]